MSELEFNLEELGQGIPTQGTPSSLRAREESEGKEHGSKKR